MSEGRPAKGGKGEKPFVFDKTKYRQKKYSHSHKLNDWKKGHKLEAERKYKKLLRKEEKKETFKQKSNPNLEPLGAEPEQAPAKRQLSGMNKAKNSYEEKVKAKQKAADEVKKNQEDKVAAVKKYKEKKAAKNKALRAVTRRGQPVMAGRMELLLQQIQQQTS